MGSYFMLIVALNKQIHLPELIYSYLNSAWTEAVLPFPEQGIIKHVLRKKQTNRKAPKALLYYDSFFMAFCKITTKIISASLSEKTEEAELFHSYIWFWLQTNLILG